MFCCLLYIGKQTKRTRTEKRHRKKSLYSFKNQKQRKHTTASNTDTYTDEDYIVTNDEFDSTLIKDYDNIDGNDDDDDVMPSLIKDDDDDDDDDDNDESVSHKIDVVNINQSTDASNHDNTNQTNNYEGCDDDEMDMDSSSTYMSEPESAADEEEEEDFEVDDDDDEGVVDKKQKCYAYIEENQEYWDHPYMVAFRRFYMNQYTEGKKYEPKRIIHMLRWTYSTVYKGKQLPPACLAKWTFFLFTKHIQLLISYTSIYMREEKRHAWGTIKLFISTILLTYWSFFTSVRENCQTKYVISANQLYQYQNTITIIRKQCNRNIKRTSKQKRHKGRMISDLEQPPGENPLIEMKKILQAKLNLYTDIKFVDNITYNKFKSFLCAAFFLGPQGGDFYL